MPTDTPFSEKRPADMPGPFRDPVLTQDIPDNVNVWSQEGKLLQSVDAPPVSFSEIGKEIAKQSALPIGLGTVGAIAGGFTGPAAPIASPLLGSIGSATGEILNQAIGITPQSKLAIGLAALPFPSSGLMRETALTMPAAKVGIQSLVVKNLGPQGERLLAAIQPPIESGKLFQRAENAGANIKVAMPNTANAVFEAQKELAKSPLKIQGGLKDLLNGADKVAGSGATSIPYQNLRALQTGTGARLRTLAVQGGEGSGLAKQLYKAMWEDMDAGLAQAQGPTASLLRDAVTARKTEEAVSLMQEMFTPAFKGGEHVLPVDQVMKRVADNKEVLARLLPDGAAGVEDVMATLKAQAKLLNKPGSGLGTAAAAHPFLAASMLGTVGISTGSSTLMGGAAISAGLGALSAFMATAPGRSMIRQMAANGVRWDTIANAIGQGLISAGTQLGPPGMTVNLGSAPGYNTIDTTNGTYITRPPQ